jgi:hypothetical protein
MQRFYTEDSAKGVPPDTVDKLQKMFVYLDNMEDPEELRTLTVWKVHTLTGDRKGIWSLSVTSATSKASSPSKRKMMRRDPSFCLPRTPAGPEPVPPALEGPEVLESTGSTGRLCRGGKPQSSPSPLSAAAGVTRNGFAEFTLPGASASRSSSHPPGSSPKRLHAPKPSPGS